WGWSSLRRAYRLARRDCRAPLPAEADLPCEGARRLLAPQATRVAGGTSHRGLEDPRAARGTRLGGARRGRRRSRRSGARELLCARAYSCLAACSTDHRPARARVLTALARV